MMYFSYLYKFHLLELKLIFHSLWIELQILSSIIGSLLTINCEIGIDHCVIIIITVNGLLLKKKYLMIQIRAWILRP